MGQFLYFIGAGPVDFLEAMNAAGIAERVSASPNRARIIGPEGKQGYMIAWGSEQIAYDPLAQIWTGPYGDCQLHIGYWRDRRPGPDDLRRPQIVSGCDVAAADGSVWHVPTWRLAPQTVCLTPTRALVYEPLPARLLLERHMRRMLTLFADVRPDEAEAEKVVSTIDDLEMLTMAAEVLSVNYRISPDPAQEVSILKLMTGPVFMQLVEAVLDLGFLGDVAKKKQRRENGDLSLLDARTAAPL